MSYIDDSLIEGETVIHVARVSWWSQAGHLVLGVLLLVVVTGLSFWWSQPGHLVLGVLLLVVVIGLFFLVMAWVNVRSTEIAITNRRVIAKFGFIRRHTVEINLDKVEALRVEQGLMGRFLNFGTIFISGAGTSVAPLRDIADPLVFRRKFMEATNRPLTRN